MVHFRWRIAIRWSSDRVFTVLSKRLSTEIHRKYHGLEKDQYQENKTQVGDGTSILMTSRRSRIRTIEPPAG